MKILSLPRVIKKTGLSKVTIWRREKEGNFPKRIQLSANRVGWIREEIEEWLRTRPRGIGSKSPEKKQLNIPKFQTNR